MLPWHRVNYFSKLSSMAVILPKNSFCLLEIMVTGQLPPGYLPRSLGLGSGSGLALGQESVLGLECLGVYDRMYVTGGKCPRTEIMEGLHHFVHLFILMNFIFLEISLW